MFASAAHDVDPPPELEERVMSVLAEEWAESGSAVTGTAVLYDSDIGQSWVLVLARRASPGGKAFVTISSPDGGKPLKLFPIAFDDRGEGSSWLVTSADISKFDHLQVRDA